MVTPKGFRDRPMVVLGEVRTRLLPNFGALGREELRELLAKGSGNRVRFRERPILVADAPMPLEPVDCRLRTLSGTKVHCVGTVATEASVVGGRVLQTSAHTTVVRAAGSRRQPWEHYTRRAGVTEVLTKLKDGAEADLAAGFLSGLTDSETLDLASICQRRLEGIWMSPQLDQRPPRLVGPTRLRWIARLEELGSPQVDFRLEGGEVQSARITVPMVEDLAAVHQFCVDLAVHDWLLTAVTSAVAESDRYRKGSLEFEQIVAETLELLEHLWMPGLRTPEQLEVLWEKREIEFGFKLDWERKVSQLHNRVSVVTLNALRENKDGENRTGTTDA